ncbi:hypothetical protein JANAI61_37610 [Jannaschia sp. AI_61]|uniref:glycosyltransferase family 2 protein n=1 Tax=Jannaschia sp. AI_61 TaxID=2829796 RepID=UPI001BB85AD5|nr:glycosyltransferase [Jannaschia sp. AI_61]GIT93303.1 hypothetical protein JANAI61_37610 [Jannaschia sp. AI_61]
MATAAVIIPHYNDLDRLLRCLAALRPQVVDGVEVVVVDNASTVDLTPLRQAHPEIRLVTETDKGAAAARNRGVIETTAPWLFFLDCDCVPKPGWLARALEQVTRADVTGGRITVFDETPAPRSGAEAFETVFAFDNRGYIEKKGFSVTANLLTTRDIFEAVGPFRGGLSEDLEWCHRATGQGATLVYDNALHVAHPTRADWPALERKWRRLTEEAWGLRGRTLPDRIAWAARALAMPVSIPVHAPRILKHPDLASPKERTRAIATLARLRTSRAKWMLHQAIQT